MTRKLLLLSATALLLASCSTTQRGPDARDRARASGPPMGASLLKYDLNHDGRITCAELETGLKTEFDALDTRHIGKLDAAQVRAANQVRWAADHSASPLVDWNQDGFVDFNEFATAPRSLFAQLDTKNLCVLTEDDLRGPQQGGQERPARRQPEGRGQRGGGPPRGASG